jgi:simple sugar transport system permease protein
MRREKLFELLRTLVAIALALLIAFIIIFFISKQPGEALSKLLFGPLTKLRYFGNVIEMAIPLTFTGLAVCVMFQARQFNMAGEGGFFIGAVAAAAVGILIPLPPVIHPLEQLLQEDW